MQEIVQKYYGETLTGAQDLQTNARCTDVGLPHFVKPLLAKVHAEVQTRVYGCGAGGEVYVLSQLVDEDHGQAVVYRDTVPHHRHVFRLDKHHWIETGKQFPVCGNTWRCMLHDTRLIEHFDFNGNFDQHFGIFPGCGIGIPFNPATSGEQKSGCY